MSLPERAITLSESLRGDSEADLRTRATELRWRVRGGEPLDRSLVEIGALVREAARRTLGLAHYPVQLAGGFAMLRGRVVEMQTGEGKTLTAVLPAFARALAGHGCHVLTVNDYLAERDAALMGPVFRLLGLSVGRILHAMDSPARREHYGRDVTYGTAKEVGFDFLRDRLNRGEEFDDGWRSDGHGERAVQRGHHFALVDEADGILIDEARTPLLIGTHTGSDAARLALYAWCHRTAGTLAAGLDFTWEPRRREARLTRRGCRSVLSASRPAVLAGTDVERLYEQTEKSLSAVHGFRRDRDYVIVDDEVAIVDESTGRVMEGRKWQDGLHQAVEAKEGVPITDATGSAAKVTVQSLFREYEHLAGMTGTAVSARRELRRAYGLRVEVIPTHRPCLRRGLPTRVFATLAAKDAAVAGEVRAAIDAGRAVLVGTPSVSASERLSVALAEAGIEHAVLNARNHAEEAGIVAEAGRAGRVTVATNMAGRGTDIALDDDVRAVGGLHVVATERHGSGRIDRQLVGRAARQGDPGTYRFLLSLEDELFRVLPAARRANLVTRAGASGEVPASWERVFLRTQALLERMHAKQRRDLLKRERERAKTHRRMGLDPYLELVET